MKYLLSLVLLVSLSIKSSSQEVQVDTAATAKAQLKQEADKMVKFFIDKNYKEYVKYIYPKLLQAVGGETKMAEAIKGMIQGMEAEGFTFDNVYVEEAKTIVTKGKTMQALVPQLLFMRNADGKLLSKSYLLAISEDKGKHWYFLDTAGKPAKQIKQIFPALSDKIEIPEKTKPVFIPNKKNT